MKKINANFHLPKKLTKPNQEQLRSLFNPKFILTLVALVLLSTYLFTIKAQQAGQGLRVTPVSFDLAIDKGLTSKGVIHLDNLTGKSVDIVVSEQNFTAQGEQGGITLTPEDSQYSLAKWIKVTPSKATIGVNGRADFDYEINVPANAEPGGHFGSIVFSTVPPKTLNTTGATLVQSVGSLFLVSVPGAVKENAVVESFTTDKPFYEFGPVNFDVRVKNNSTVHIKPIGVITIKNDLTGVKTVVGIDGKNVLPGAIRQVPATWDQNFLFGKYTATANLNYGSKSYPLATSTTFIGFPVRIALIVFFILVILFMGRRRIGKALKTIVKG